MVLKQRYEPGAVRAPVDGSIEGCIRAVSRQCHV